MSGETAVWADIASDGAYDTAAEPLGSLSMPIAKAVNYVALGDSYSAGEAGDDQDSNFVGKYQSGLSNADEECRRWDQAYPYVFGDRVLGDPDYSVTVMFETFACVGAITHNVYDARDPAGISEVYEHLMTNQPSHSALGYEIDKTTGRARLVDENKYEPRQARSLSDARRRLREAMRDVDMVTITIGGNDVGFAGILMACVFPDPSAIQGAVSAFITDGFQCREAPGGRINSVEDRIEDVLSELAEIAPNASIFVLGYPHLTPQPTPCPPRTSHCRELGLNGHIDECRALSAAEIVTHTLDHGLPGIVAGVPILGVGVTLGDVADLLDDSHKIDHIEAQYLWSGARQLNTAVRNAAAAAGVHYVGVSGVEPSQHLPDRVYFHGHDPCAGEPWLNGFLLDASKTPASSDASFHPTVAGHDAYASLLARYIKQQYAVGAELNAAGLPFNPAPSGQ